MSTLNMKVTSTPKMLPLTERATVVVHKSTEFTADSAITIINFIRHSLSYVIALWNPSLIFDASLSVSCSCCDSRSHRRCFIAQCAIAEINIERQVKSPIKTDQPLAGAVTSHYFFGAQATHLYCVVFLVRDPRLPHHGQQSNTSASVCGWRMGWHGIGQFRLFVHRQSFSITLNFINCRPADDGTVYLRNLPARICLLLRADNSNSLTLFL